MWISGYPYYLSSVLSISFLHLINSYVNWIILIGIWWKTMRIWSILKYRTEMFRYWCCFMSCSVRLSQFYRLAGIGHFSKQIVPGLVYKFGIFYAHVFLVTFKFFTNLYGIGLRIDSFKWVLGDIKFRKFNRLDVLPRYQLKIRLWMELVN